VKKISVQHVKYLPKQLSEGILYVSSEYAVAGHLCGCGCGTKVITPLGHAEWTFLEREGRPTLRPSIGNWQIPCRSHYFITDGQVEFAAQWSDAEIAAGRHAEERRRREYYESTYGKRGLLHRIWGFVNKVFGG
jgi:hypothetical protein